MGSLRKSLGKLQNDFTGVDFNEVTATRHARALVPSKSERLPKETMTMIVNWSAEQMAFASK
jgi:hypothetical protein